MKMMMYVTTENAMRSLNILVIMENVYQNSGSAILTMIVVMTAMNQPIFVDTETVQPDGEGAPVTLITDVSPSGFSVMGKMIAETRQMSFQRIVQNAKKRETSSVEINDVFRRDGFVILRMIVETILMKMKPCVRANTENAQSQSINVIMINVFQPGGNVITMMIVGMAVMRQVALITLVQKVGSDVHRVTVLKKS